ncbi:hypothetical protein J2795_001636 [Chryseobacterium bernardetii]|uniref:Uncharacterized protein n=1 Tax=Chryseobacterium bernardetii TaxID=1241978 RepID=A0ACC6IT28_9FLAO|nr:hypothetical protein [Chryseobacterium vietnamense]MDR6440936.1 hypothetical protein [Chryseobacterium bernardetii]
MPFAECNALANLIKEVVKKFADSALKKITPIKKNTF